jgi:hypothetical protein
MKLPPTRSLLATAAAVLIAAPFLLMYARWRGLWLWPGLAFLAIAAVWRLLWFPRSGYISLACAGAGLLAGIGLGFLASFPFIKTFQGINIRPSLIQMVFMFHGSWLGLLAGLVLGYYLHLKRIMNPQAAPVAQVSLAPAAAPPQAPPPGQTQ